MSGFSSDPSFTPTPVDLPIRIHLTSSYGGGFCEWISVAPGTTIQDLFESRTNGAPASSFLIMLNGNQRPSGSTVLSDGDRVTFTPQKITVA